MSGRRMQEHGTRKMERDQCNVLINLISWNADRCITEIISSVASTEEKISETCEATKTNSMPECAE
jgi:hypothetical protein